MSNSLLSILIVSYNTREMTLACIASVFDQTRNTPFELIVWDNASQDSSAEAIRDAFGERVRLIASNENIGFAAANNRAAEMAMGDRLLLLNPDTVVLDRAIDNLVAFSAAWPVAGIWGGRTVFGNGTLNPASCWGRQSLWTLFCQATGLSSMFRQSGVFNREGMGGWNREGARAVDIVTGCFLLIRSDLWNMLGGFREEFFMYGEEADLCLRARTLGAMPAITSEATIVHYGGASERIRADKMVKLLKAKMLLVEFHFSPATRTIGKWLLALWPLSRYGMHKLLAASGRRASDEARDVWREVFARKRDWFVSRGTNSQSKE